MTNTLIVHDTTGYVLQQITGNYRIPSGVPYMEVDIPQGKQLKITDGIGVDISVTPHKAILEDVPPTEIEVLKEDTSTIAEMTATVAEDNASIADTLATVLLEIESMKADISSLKGA